MPTTRNKGFDSSSPANVKGKDLTPAMTPAMTPASLSYHLHREIPLLGSFATSIDLTS